MNDKSQTICKDTNIHQNVKITSLQFIFLLLQFQHQNVLQLSSNLKTIGQFTETKR